jgi:hypothetical protein
LDGEIAALNVRRTSQKSIHPFLGNFEGNMNDQPNFQQPYLSAQQLRGLQATFLEHQLFGNRIVAREPLARPGPVPNPQTLTDIIRYDPPPAALIIADRHPLSAITAQDETLQQGWSFSRRAQARWGIGSAVGR